MDFEVYQKTLDCEESVEFFDRQGILRVGLLRVGF